jgi:hypothetical protein
VGVGGLLDLLILDLLIVGGLLDLLILCVVKGQPPAPVLRHGGLRVRREERLHHRQ